jgi:predicted alpha/beta hydrolase family esterase
MLSTVFDVFFAAPLVFLAATTLLTQWLNPARRRGKQAQTTAGKSLYFYCREYLRLLVYQLVYITVAPAEFLLHKTAKGKTAEQPTSADRPVIVLIHGYISTRSHWLFQEWLLKREGYEDVVRFGYNPFSGSLQEWSASLAGMLKERYPSRRVVLAGHSYGGLIAIRAASLTPEGMVEKVVTMGSPIEGTLMARFALTHTARELRRGAETIDAIGEEIKSLKAELVCCWSRWDGIVVPPESAAPKNARRVELEGVGHSGYCFDSRVLAQITGAEG